MPDQVADLPVVSNRNLKSFSRPSRAETPSTPFQEVLKHRSRTDSTKDLLKPAHESAPVDTKSAKINNTSKRQANQPDTSSEQSADGEESVSEPLNPSGSKTGEPAPETVSEDSPADSESAISADTEPQSDNAKTDDTTGQMELLSLLVPSAGSGDDAQPAASGLVRNIPNNVQTSTPIELTEAAPIEGTSAHAAISKMSMPPQSAVLNADPSLTGDASTTSQHPEMGAVPAKTQDQTSSSTTDEWMIQEMSPFQDQDAAPTIHSLSHTTEADSGLNPNPASVTPKPVSEVAKVIHAPQPSSLPEDRFLEQNVDRIVTSIKSDLTPNGGTMKIRLDPPNLGQLQIDVSVDDGTLTASFQTSNEEATRLLSHSMQQLKHSLEAAGVSVDRIQVRQTSESSSSNSTRSGDQDSSSQQHSREDHSQRQEQQRRDFLQKMWEKIAFGQEPLDLVV